MSWKIDFEGVKNGKVRKGNAIATDDASGVIGSDEINLGSAKDRRRGAKELAQQMERYLPSVTAEEVAEKLEPAWHTALAKLLAMQAQEEAAAAAPPAPPAVEDADAQSARLLAEMPVDVRAEAEVMLKAPNLLQQIIDDVAALGVAGERELAATVYLIGTSRKLARPQAGRVKGPSSSGKSFLIDKVAKLFPAEAVIRATQMTPQALFHMPEGALRHRWIVAGERSRKEDDDAAEATRALREMISAGRLSKLMPVKAGNDLETKLVEQEGPIAYIESTTLENIFEEDENRCLSLFTDERPDQTRRIIERIANSAASGTTDHAEERIVLRHHAIQRMLRRQTISVPFAPRLGRLIPETRVEARRAFPHLLAMVMTSALLHQQQRQTDAAGRLIATRDDYQIARRLLQNPMRRLLCGGIGEPVQRFLDRLYCWFTHEQFTSRDAKAREENSRASVHGWLSDLHRQGALDLVEESRGRKPAVWRIPLQQEAGVAADSPLPTDQQVFEEARE